MASVAYKLAMPKMDSLPSIRASIACIAQGAALGIRRARQFHNSSTPHKLRSRVLKQKGTKK